VPVGFKWFVPGLLDGSFGFGGEESARRSFLRRDGSVWTTDKDGIILALLAAEIMATAGKDPAQVYQDLTQRFGAPVYARIDAPATARQRQVLKALSAGDVRRHLGSAGEPILDRLTHAHRERRADRRALKGCGRERLVRGAARLAQRTSTRSTRRVSRVTTTCGASRRKPRPSSPPPSRRRA